MLPYTPFTSQDLIGATSAIQDLSQFAGGSNIPSGRQVVFFSLGIIAIIASLALVIQTLAASELPAIASVAKAVAI